MTGGRARVAVCADVGSTWTKVAAVDLDRATLHATAAHPTTVDSDVLRGLDAALAAAVGDATVESIDVCSSAGGGLRLAVVGYEPLVTAEAGQRVGLSAGARVVHTTAGALTPDGVRALRLARPDVLLLVGGTDGGDADVLLHNAARLAAARVRTPVVLAGNQDARDEALAKLVARGMAVVATDNVLPRIGVLNPQPARAAIREVFLRHVIGGKGLSKGPRFASLVRGATPDVVLTAVELLSDVVGADLAVLDIGGATTDVYSVLRPDPDAPPPSDVAGVQWQSRTVEGDLGLRWNAPGIVDAAAAERLLAPDDSLRAAAARRAADPAMVPDTLAERACDIRLAELAAMVALRRHARGEPGDGGRRTGGRDLSRLRLVIGSGGVLRHAAPANAHRALAAVLADHAGGWVLPKAAQSIVDYEYALAPIGLLAGRNPPVAAALARALIGGGSSRRPGSPVASR